ncbi:hypothetical protein NSU_3645 [Novosphingobium pentaromativorans US6-1]|uniref:Uncharacterized protein n=1 Tax=Novosphingobium pentaromativorans US6-1 TaxID=1088721 RepID=G6EH24_9SPHN|nr:hypothetical protein NSU_3645 [Novosphingobium pentaromativorans US6-1]
MGGVDFPAYVGLAAIACMSSESVLIVTHVRICSDLLS